MFYDYHKILTYNAFLNFLIGERGVGKTYGISKFVLNKFIKKNEEFAYIRRYKSELKMAVPTFFDSLINNNEFPDNKFYNKGNKFYCDDKICGHAFTLSTAQDLKSSNFSNVKYIIFDEFIIEEGQKKYYLKNEAMMFLGLIETIARLRDVKVFFLGNPSNVYNNPYFLFFNLELPSNSDIKLFKDGLILLQYMKNETYRENKKNTKFGKLIEGTLYEDFAVYNSSSIVNDKNFIDKKSSSARFNFGFIYQGITYGVWIDSALGAIYIDLTFDKNSKFIFACSLKDHKPNTMLLSSLNNYHCWKNLKKNVELRQCFFL